MNVKRSQRQSIRFAVALLCCCLVPAAVRAADDEDGLLRLVGGDAGVVIEANGLGGNLKKLKQCTVTQRFEQTEFYRQWRAGGDYGKLRAAMDAVEKLVGKPLEKFFDEVFGRSVVLAVYPTESDEAHTVLLLRAADAAALESAVAAWNRAEGVQLRRTRTGGREYVVRLRGGDSGEKSAERQYYVRQGKTFAFSNDEASIRRVVSRLTGEESDSQAQPSAADAEDGERFLSLPANRAGRQSLPAGSIVSLYLNPRVWDRQVKADAGKDVGAQFLLELWERCDAIACGLYADESGLFVEGAVHYDGAEAATSDAAVGKPLPAFLKSVPREAVAVFAGRHNLAGAARWLLGRIPAKERADWTRVRELARGLLVGFDLFDDVLPALGRNWGAYVIGAPAVGSRAPLEAVVGVELPPPGEVKHDGVTLRDGLENALETALRLAATADDQTKPQSIGVRTATEKETRLGWVETGNAYRPAYALTPDHLAVGTSPAVLRQFAALDANRSLAGDRQFLAAAERSPRSREHLLYVNAAALRNLVARHGSSFAARLADSKEVSRKEAAGRVASIRDLLGSFDAVFCGGGTEGGVLRIVAGVSASGE